MNCPNPISKTKTNIAGFVGRSIPGMGASVGVLIEAGFTFEQLKTAVKKYQTLNEKESDSFSDLIKSKAPAHLLMQYLFAPVDPVQSVATRGTIMEDFTKNQIAQADNHVVTRALTTVSVLAGLCASPVFLGVNALSMGWELPGLRSGVEQFNHLLAGMLASNLDVSGVNLPLGAAGVSVAGLLALKSLAESGMGVKKSWVQAKKYNNLWDRLTEDDAPEFNSQFGFKEKRKELLDAYNQVSVAERHLLTQLSPIDLRVFLLSSDQVRGDILNKNPPSFEDRMNNVIARYQDQDISLRKLLAVANDIIDANATPWGIEIVTSSTSMKAALLRMREQKSIVGSPKPSMG